ncbi:MAG: amidohydrolase [Caldiserica bacterium]|jgi:predicted amidohydrolase YtcJ|nr:amidohydrolase [Caldisericota bacterium]MDH7563028.1 amidohydrolase [Caldisericota bacterium]
MDFILKDGFVFSGGEFFQSDVVISGDLILKVGKVKKGEFPGFEKIDCSGKLVLPSFTDSHLHLEAFADSLGEVDLRNAKTLEEALYLVSEFRKAIPSGDWITGGRWDKNLWKEPCFPKASDLDPVTGDHPAALWSKDGHALWLNSLAMSALKISRETPDPPGGKILREDDGTPSGILLENACDLYGGKLSNLKEEGEPDLKKAVRYLQKQGVSGCNWILERDWDPLSFISYLDSQNLDFDCTLWFPRESIEAVIKSGLKSGDGTDRVKLGGIKLFADGALGSQTALLLSPYEGSTSCGIEVTPKSELEKIVSLLAEKEIGVSIHAIGDLAVRNAIQAFYPKRDVNMKLRSRIEHVQLIHPDDLAPFFKSGLMASVQPIHAVSDRKMAIALWGERVKFSYPYRSLHSAGIHLAFGSDAPVEEPSPLKGIYAACLRQTPFVEEEPFLPEEALDLKDALEAYTYWGAWGTFQEKNKGRIAPGIKGDLVVLSENLGKKPLKALGKTEVFLLLYRGKIVRV